jgi:UDP-glucose 4-epimerase
MRTVGVTGAAGFIGSHLCRRLLDEGLEVVGVDNLTYGSLGNVASCLEDTRFRLERFDCANKRQLRTAFADCDTIVHLAARKIPRYGGAVATIEGNISGVHAACSVALALDAELVIASTSDVYGNAPAPFVEDGPLVLGPPTTRRWAYAASKLVDEHIALALAEERGLRVSILRLFNVYGPQNHLSWWGGPVVTFMEALLAGEPIEIHGDGLQVRTFTYVEDTIEAFVRTLRTPVARGEVINVSGNETLTILELAERVAAVMEQDASLRFTPYESLPGRYQDVLIRIPDTSKARALLGFEARVGVNEGLERTLAWHRSLRTETEAVTA